MALATSGLAFTGSAGLLLGMAQSGTTYAVVYGVIARNVARKALLGHGRGRGGGLLRPVPDGAGGDLADQRLGLAERTVRAGLPGAGHHAAGLGPARAGGGTAHVGHRQSVGSAVREAFGYPSFGC
jgi:hypothetical protein